MDKKQQIDEFDKRVTQAINYAEHELELFLCEIVGVLEANKENLLKRYLKTDE